MNNEVRIPIRTEGDLARAIVCLRERAMSQGFNHVATSKIATAMSELVRNILKYAGTGDVSIRQIKRDLAIGIEITVRDDGPGIADIDHALRDHVSTGGTLGLGLPGVKRLMDEFEITSSPGRGTRVQIRKWRERC